VDEEDSEEVICVVRRLLYTPTQSNETQHKQMFKGKCFVANKVCKLSD